MSDAPEKQGPILEPEFLFLTETITGPENTSFQTMELVRNSQPLLRLVTSTAKKTSGKPLELVTGKHTLLSDDKLSIIAAIDGYPTVSRKSSKDIDLIMVTIIPLITLSEDRMEAVITLYPPPGDTPGPNPELIQEALDFHGVRFGVMSDQLQQLLEQLKEEKLPLKDKPIARGLLPMNGKDSFLRFNIEVGPLPGKLLGNGKIDFRERKMFVGVAEGQVIATRVPPTEGTPGLTVTGEEVPQLPGRDIPINVSDDAVYDEEQGVVIARRSGILSLVNDTSIKVCAKQLIPGNVDYSTGNIESQDAVEIKGTILPGFKVDTHGDLLLGGNVRSANIKCRGNLVIKGGILGKQCKVTVDGDADFSFMEQGRLRVKGKTILRKQAYYSSIMSDGQILGEKSSQVMAGFLMSGGSLVLGNVGSPNAPPALLAAGISPGRYLRYLRIRSRLREIEQERLLFLQRYGMKQNTKQRLSLEEAIETLYQDMCSLNLIPVNDDSSDEQKRDFLNTISITVVGTIFNGTEIQIGNATTTVRYDLRAVRFSLNPDNETFINTDL